MELVEQKADMIEVDLEEDQVEVWTSQEASVDMVIRTWQCQERSFSISHNLLFVVATCWVRAPDLLP